MDLFGILGACLRRWYVTVPLLLVTAGFAAQSYRTVEPVYSGTVSLVVLPSLKKADGAQAESEEASGRNPYSGQGGARFAVAVLARNVNSPAFRSKLGLAPTSTELVQATTGSQQPIIQIDAQAATPDAVYALLDRASEQAGVVLNEFQAEAGAPADTRYRMAPGVPAGGVVDVTPSRLRVSGAIAVVGFGLAAALATVLDVVLLQRRRRREAGHDGRRERVTPQTAPTAEDPHTTAPTEAAGAPQATDTPQPSGPPQTADPQTPAPADSEPATPSRGGVPPKHRAPDRDVEPAMARASLPADS
jgi:hypothetical protein